MHLHRWKTSGLLCKKSQLTSCRHGNPLGIGGFHGSPFPARTMLARMLKACMSDKNMCLEQSRDHICWHVFNCQGVCLIKCFGNSIPYFWDVSRPIPDSTKVEDDKTQSINSMAARGYPPAFGCFSSTKGYAPKDSKQNSWSCYVLKNLSICWHVERCGTKHWKRKTTWSTNFSHGKHAITILPSSAKSICDVLE